MAEFLHPGVFVEESSFRAPFIAGVPTGLAGFVRLDTRQAGLAGPFASAAAFEQHDIPWDAVRAFFDEGGKRLFVAHAATDDEAGITAALQELAEADPDLVAAPGLTGAHITPALIAHAEAHHRFALIDPTPQLDIDAVRALRAGFESSRAALYWPWIVTAAGAQPPSAAIAGIIARVDSERGVWKAPANEIINGAAGFQHDVTKAEQELLNPLGINCLRAFTGRGNRVSGARTLSTDPEWKYVSLRRQCDWIERSLQAGLGWAVFEPNAELLWGNVRAAVSDFLYRHWQAGALLGAKPEAAFFVRCDRSTMTQNDLDNGRLIIEIGVAPIKPAEFIIMRITVATAGQQQR